MTSIINNSNKFYKISLVTDIALLSLFVGVAFSSVYNFDFFWHLKTGSLFLKNLGFFYHDPYSVAGDSLSWSNFHWLFQTMIALVNKIAGVEGFAFLKLGLFFILFYLCIPIRNNSITLKIVTLIAILALSNRCMLRPELFTYFYMILIIKILVTPLRNRHFVYLPLLQIFFVNSHSLFFLGSLLIFFKVIHELFFLKTASSRIIIGYFMIFIITIMVSAISPYGLKGMLFPLKLISKVTVGNDIFKHYILEFSNFNGYILTNIYNLIYLILSVLLALYFVCKREVFSALTIGFLILLSLQAMRNFNLLLFPVLFFFANSSLPATLDSKILKRSQLVIFSSMAAIAFFLAFSFISNDYYLKYNMLPRFGKKPNLSVFSKDFPLFLDKIKGNPVMFNTMSLGGYLIYYSNVKVFYDGRLDVYGEDYFKLYLNMTQDKQFFLKEADKQNINFVVLNHSINEGPNLMDLNALSNWQLVYLDYNVVAFARKGEFFERNSKLFHLDQKQLKNHLQTQLNEFPDNEKELQKNILQLALSKLNI